MQKINNSCVKNKKPLQLSKMVIGISLASLFAVSCTQPVTSTNTLDKAQTEDNQINTQVSSDAVMNNSALNSEKNNVTNNVSNTLYKKPTSNSLHTISADKSTTQISDNPNTLDSSNTLNRSDTFDNSDNNTSNANSTTSKYQGNASDLRNTSSTINANKKLIPAYNFATDTRDEDRDGFSGLNPIISKAPFTCTPSHKLIKLGPDCTTVKQANYYDLEPLNNTWIDAQVYVPQHYQGEKLPVIVHSHGYGSSKLARLTEIPECKDSEQPYNCPLGENEGFERFQGMFEQTERMLTDLVNKGYIVVSYSQRGFGESEGDIMLMNPYHETQDGIALLDWIAKQGKNGNLPIAVDNNNDFTIGLLGGSYGGGFQFPLAALDTRIDTIVPIGTWNSISRALVPNGATKGGWGNLLCMMSMGKNQHHYLREACTRISLPTVRTERKFDRYQRLMPYINQSGLSYFKHLENHQLPFRDGESAFTLRPVDTLLVQGLRDVLFDGEEVTRNYEYLKSAGGDVRMLTNQSGHISPFANQNSAGTMNCGQTDMFRAIRIWLDVKLRGKPSSLLDEIPQVCMSLDNSTAVNLTDVPDNNNSNVVSKPFSISIGNLRGPVKCEIIHEVSSDDAVLAGRVQLNSLSVRDDTLVNAGVAYLGLCMERDGKTTLIDDVITGYPKGYHAQSNFVTVGEKLRAGDKIGIMGVKDHVQMFAFGPSAVPNLGALVIQGFKPGASKHTDFIDNTLPNSEWASVGMFSINAFTANGTITLPIFDVNNQDLSIKYEPR